MDPELKACFLVAAPMLRCPFFSHALVLLVDHREDGSLGFVVNKPSDVSFGDVLTQIGLEAGPLDEDRTVMVGGPVSPDTGWVVFDARDGDECGEGVIELENGVGVSANMEILERIARGEGPDTFLMMLGYAGWGPGQLDDEIRDGSWIPVDLDPALVFDTPIGERWAAALAKLGIDPARMTSRFVADA